MNGIISRSDTREKKMSKFNDVNKNHIFNVPRENNSNMVMPASQSIDKCSFLFSRGVYLVLDLTFIEYLGEFG